MILMTFCLENSELKFHDGLWNLVLMNSWNKIFILRTKLILVFKMYPIEECFWQKRCEHFMSCRHVSITVSIFKF